MTDGYSGITLSKKLGIRSGMLVVTVGAPMNYLELIDPLPDAVIITDRHELSADVIHIFTNSRDELFEKVARCARQIKQEGAIWVSWYKKASKLPTEITEDTVREAAFPL